MADQKVSDLPSLNGADVDAADLLYIVDSSAGTAGSKKITIGQYQLAPVSGGTANGVLYLNASKVLTSGSALTFDGTNFATTGTVTATKLVPTGNVTAGNGMYLPAANTLAWSTNGAEGMRLDSSGNLGIGTTSPGYKFQVASGATAATSYFSSTATPAYSATAYNGGNARIALVGGNASGATTGINFSQGGSFEAYFGGVQESGGAAAFVWQGYSGSAYSERMRLDSSGNLGLGVTPVAYTANARTFQLDGGANSAQIRLTNNTTGTAQTNGGLLSMDGNQLSVWNVENDALRFGTNDTERARITSGGSFWVGSTGISTNYQFEVVNTGAGKYGGIFKNDDQPSATLDLWNASTSGDAVFVGFYTEAAATGRGSISYNRAGGLVAYNTTSDYRAKDIIGPVQNPGATIDALKVYEGVMKGATQSRPMLIAHEAQEHAPYAVSGIKDEVNEDGTPKFQQMDVSSLVPLLLAEIQSLRARVAALEAK